MDFIIDEDRIKYLYQLSDLQKKVNPKPFTEEERKRAIEERIQARNERCFGVEKVEIVN